MKTFIVLIVLASAFFSAVQSVTVCDNFKSVPGNFSSFAGTWDVRSGTLCGKMVITPATPSTNDNTDKGMLTITIGTLPLEFTYTELATENGAHARLYEVLTQDEYIGTVVASNICSFIFVTCRVVRAGDNLKECQLPTVYLCSKDINCFTEDIVAKATAQGVNTAGLLTIICL